MFAFTKQPRLAACAYDLLGGPVYLHQAKLNSKVAFRGSAVEWHRDFDFWSQLDGMPDSAATTAAVLIDAVDEYNAPLLLIPGSHTSPALGASAYRTANNTEGGTDLANVGSWIGATRAGDSTVVGDLKYVVEDRHVVEPILALKGDMGTVVFFHSNLIHGSGCNMSPRGRRMLFCSFNRTSNSLRPVRNPRPPHIANRDFTPLLTEETEAP
ncbi:MAG: phytanoyl-CoA dioxygenase family protein [Egibacteraceae bacterium]